MTKCHWEKVGIIIDNYIKCAIIKLINMKIGIYRIINILNGKMYIGSSKNLNERKINHFSELKNNKHHSIHLQRAYNKLKDKNNFKFEILEECNSEELMEKENYYLNLYCKSNDYINNLNKDFLKLSYNILPFAQKGFCGKHRKETIEKLKLVHPFRKDIVIYDSNGKFIEQLSSSQEVQNKYNISKNSILLLCKSKKYICKKSNILVGFLNDDNFIKFIENSSKPIIFKPYNKGKKYSKEEKINMGISIVVKNLKTNEINEFTSQKEACEYFNLQPCTINRCLKKKKAYRKYLLFNYKDIV